MGPCSSTVSNVTDGQNIDTSIAVAINVIKWHQNWDAKEGEDSEQHNAHSQQSKKHVSIKTHADLHVFIFGFQQGWNPPKYAFWKRRRSFTVTHA
jgi:hypothetical protein